MIFRTIITSDEELALSADPFQSERVMTVRIKYGHYLLPVLV
jgi:hypothetical protein